MSRTLDDPLTVKELQHMRDKFWEEISSQKEEDLERSLKYIEVVEIMEKIAVCIYHVKQEFKENPGRFNDVLGAHDQFFQDIINSVFG